MTPEPTWETVTFERDSNGDIITRLRRIQVPSGWLYRLEDLKGNPPTVTFVPNPPVVDVEDDDEEEWDDDILGTRIFIDVEECEDAL